MELADVPWVTLAGAAIPVVGIIWKLLADRGAKMANEIAQFEQAIASAKARDDPIQHAYRAVALERLNRVHQKDRSSSGFVFFLLWGAYAVLLWGITLTAEPGTDDAVFLSIGALASSFLALRGWAKWTAGNATLEPQANAAYRRALTDSRRLFVQQAEQLPDLEQPPGLLKIMRRKTLDLSPSKRQELAAMIWCFIAAVPTAFLIHKAVNLDWFEYRIATQLTLAISFGSLLWLLRKVHRRTKALLPFQVKPKYDGFVIALSALVTVAIAAWLAFQLSEWIVQMATRETLTEMDAWGWSFVLAIILTVSAYLFYLDRRPRE